NIGGDTIYRHLVSRKVNAIAAFILEHLQIYLTLTFAGTGAVDSATSPEARKHHHRQISAHFSQACRNLAGQFAMGDGGSISDIPENTPLPQPKRYNTSSPC